MFGASACWCLNPRTIPNRPREEQYPQPGTRGWTQDFPKENGVCRFRGPKPQRASNYSLDRMAESPDLDPAKFDRASHDEAWGCAYSKVRRAYLEV